jgi:phytoene dehydrogenase-like protein
MSGPVVVIGGGHNGLTAATLLAKAGRKVVLLEANSVLGGLARASEFHPGYHSVGLLHDTSTVRAKVIKSLKLGAYGLELRERVPQVVLTEKGLVRLAGAEATGAVSESDKAAYAELMRFLGRLKKPLGRVLENPPPNPLGRLSALMRPALGIRSLGSSDMVELLRAPSMCVADWMRDTFSSEGLSAGIAHSSLIGSAAGPWSPWTAANLLFEGATQGQEVVGGPAALVNALEKAARDAGVDIRTGTSVARIVADRATVIRVECEDGESLDTSLVLSTCDPKTTFLKLLGTRQLTDGLIRSVSNIRMRGTTAKLNVALQGALKTSDGTVVELLRTGSTLDDLERAYDASKYRQASKKPILDIRSFAGEGCAPSGDSVLSILAHYAPYNVEGGWNDAARSDFEATVVEQLEAVCPGTKERIVGTQLLTPTDIEEQHLISEGHVFHGEHAPDQLLFMRPTIDMGNYATPFKGLYVGGSGCHPGGGISCAPGYLAAKAILKAK